MAKYSRQLDESLVEMVNQAVLDAGLVSLGINVTPIRLLKSTKEIGQIIRGNELVELFTKESDVVAIALYEPIFDKVDDETKKIWIESLVSQINYDMEKDKLQIVKPEIQIPIGMYHKYGNVAVQKMELALHTIQQIIEEEKRLKAAANVAKRTKKKKV